MGYYAVVLLVRKLLDELIVMDQGNNRDAARYVFECSIVKALSLAQAISLCINGEGRNDDRLNL